MAFPLSYSTLHWQTPDLENDLGALVEKGWDGWESRQSLDWLGSAKRVKSICKSVGIGISAICGPNATLDTTSEAHEMTKRKIEFAADLEVPLFMTKGPGRMGLPTPARDEDLDRMAVAYEDLATFGESLGVTVTFHPHINHLVDSANEFQRFMTRLSKCRLCLDMSHLVLWGMDPIQAVHDYADEIAYVHLHDYKDDTPSDLGDGPMCNFGAFMRALEEIGYSDWITVCPGNTNRTEAEQMHVNRTYLKNLGYLGCG